MQWYPKETRYKFKTFEVFFFMYLLCEKIIELKKNRPESKLQTIEMNHAFLELARYVTDPKKIPIFDKWQSKSILSFGYLRFLVFARDSRNLPSVWP